MTYTTTEEKTFEASKQGKNLTACVDQAVVQVAQDAKKAGFDHPVLGTFLVSADYRDDEFHVEAVTVYARIVPTIGHRGKMRPPKPGVAPVAPPEAESGLADSWPPAEPF